MYGARVGMWPNSIVVIDVFWRTAGGVAIHTTNRPRQPLLLRPSEDSGERTGNSSGP